METTFTNSCIPFDYPCKVDDKYIDPCNCQNFYLCQFPTKTILRGCSDGTLFNHVSGNCEEENEVTIINKLCKTDQPWERCDKEADADIPALRERCTGIAPTPGPSTSPPPAAVTGDNTGAIVGGIIAVLLVIAIVALLFILYKRRGKPMSHYMSQFKLKKQVSNPEYDNKDETYSEIKDVMGTPVYNDAMKGNNPGLPNRPSMTQSPTLKVGHHEEVAYDNPGYTPSTDDDDVIRSTPSLNVSRSSLQPPVMRHRSGDEDGDRESTYSDLDQASLDIPVSKPYTPLSVYTRGPNPMSRPGEDGTPQVRDTEYEVPRPIPEYYELQPNSNCVS